MSTKKRTFPFNDNGNHNFINATLLDPCVEGVAAFAFLILIGKAILSFYILSMLKCLHLEATGLPCSIYSSDVLTLSASPFNAASQEAQH